MNFFLQFCPPCFLIFSLTILRVLPKTIFEFIIHYQCLYSNGTASTLFIGQLLFLGFPLPSLVVLFCLLLSTLWVHAQMILLRDNSILCPNIIATTQGNLEQNHHTTTPGIITIREVLGDIGR